MPAFRYWMHHLFKGKSNCSDTGYLYLLFALCLMYFETVRRHCRRHQHRNRKVLQENLGTVTPKMKIQASEMAFVKLHSCFRTCWEKKCFCALLLFHSVSTIFICVSKLIFYMTLIWFSCVFQIEDGSWRKTQFFFHTQDTNQLPVVQVNALPHLKPGQQHFIESGSVCFL